MTDCNNFWVGLALTATALLISLCLNVVFCYLRCRERFYRKDTDDDLLYPESSQRESGFSPLFVEDQHQQQENPIYGNINTDRGVPEGNFEEVCYESMTMQRVREVGQPITPAEPDLNYASLDLNMAAQKRKKKRRHQQGQNQHQAQARLSQPQSQASAQMGGFLEVEAIVEATLPSRSSSPMASRHSIYLNSQQMALETEEREREKLRDMERERVRNLSDEGGMQWEVDAQWERAREREWNRDYGVNVGEAEREGEIDMETIHECSDHFSSNLNHEPISEPDEIV
ncbi:histone-lysine N-methyltransferase set1 isoform X1 [Osmerus mordax]|uniref:histone-lysine N-methyltransferase set1 isoform X1 n=1 Tax=Osmerus mordax TaxID=8014 RepID=UPI003510B62B